MDFSDGLAAAAMALALITILLGVLFYKWQNDLAKEMHQLLGEIRGRTTATQEQQQEQLKQLLDFALGQQQASIGEELSGRVDAFEKQAAALEAKLSTGGDQEHNGVIDELKREVENLANHIKSLGEGAAPQPPPRGSETPFLDKIIQEEAYRRWRGSGSVEPTEGEPET